ncbi:MAG TPA: PD-(D/E)XK nuclease family protein, partial [Thermoanaerobaculia bacterium]|nr:PD-(D/E)XK nuclease family protein [Thermoanaerobaculia bacterium]
DDGGGRRALGGPFVDLRLAFAALSAGRLAEVAALDLDDLLGDRDGLPLPVRQGLSYAEPDEGDGATADESGDDEGADDGGEDDDEEGAGSGEAAHADPATSRRDRRAARRPASAARRRWVRRPLLAAAVAAAGELLADLEGWPRSAPAATHVDRLRRLLTRRLRWRTDGPELAPLFELLDGVAADLPADLGLDFDELRLLLGRLLDEVGSGRLGGAGGGVQVLTVTEARGRTFEHLFVVGVHRGAFPRVVEADPLLPDELRGVLSIVLPDLAKKRAGHEEERYLFAQLLSAAPRVTVSWWSHDADGQPLSPSPLVSRLPGFDPLDPPSEAVAAPSVFSPSRPDAGPRPAGEEAIVAGLRGMDRDGWQSLLAAALAEARNRLPPPGSPLEAREIAAARRRVLDEYDPPGAERAAGLGPYFGFLGAVAAGRQDPRAGTGSLWVSRAENLAACPWQLFLRKLLRLEPTPDPLAALPGLDPLVLGNCVHGVLEAIVERAGAAVGGDLAALATAPPVPVPWPGDAELDELLAAEARRALADAGMPLPGLARALAARARPYVERARALDWPSAGSARSTLPVVGAEVEGEVTVLDHAGEPRRLRFRADRVDRGEGGTGALRLTDYKSGRALSEAKRESTRESHHHRGLLAGQRLQATAYRIAAGAAEEAGPGEGEPVGRYLFLKPEIEDDAAADATAGDRFAVDFDGVVADLFSAWDSGAFFPRLVDPHGEKEPARCGFCEVSEACLRLDSSARRRLAAWNLERAGGAETAAERAHHEVWRLALGMPRTEGGDG